MDILNALANEAPVKSNRNCKIQRWLDDIPEDTPGKADLVAAVTITDRADPAFRSADQVDKILYRLGLVTSIKSIGDHRAGRCRCLI